MTYHDIFPTISGPLRSSDPIFANMKFMKIEDIYKYQVTKFVFTCLNHTAPEQFCEWFKFNYQRHGHRTRSHLNINAGTTIKNLFVPSALLIMG